MADFSAAYSSAFSATGGVTTPATLLEILKQYLGIEVGDTTQDVNLTEALNRAGDMIETMLDRIVARRETTEYFAHHFGTVQLHEKPLTGAVVVTVDGVTQTDYSAFTDRSGTFLSRTGYRHDMPMDWRRFEQVEVTYTAGFDPIPSDLGNAIVWTAATIFNSFGTGTAPNAGGTGEIKSMSIHDVGSMSFDVGQAGAAENYASFGTVVPVAAHPILSRYRILAA